MSVMEQGAFFQQLSRILNGFTPPVFYIEIIIRAVIIYLVLLGSLRFMGKRMASRLSRNELAAMVTLAAAIGIPIQTPDKGLLPSLIMAVIVILVQRGIAAYSTRNQSFERFTQGSISVLVQDSFLQLREMARTGISRDRLFSQLRTHGVRHLGEVKRLYLEASGAFTLIRNKDIQPGLNVLPEWDHEFRGEQRPAADKIVCGNCGHAIGPEAVQCPNCHKQEFVTAIF